MLNCSYKIILLSYVTGTQRPVRRRVLPSHSPIARGITWQWEGDIPGSWNDFDVDVAEFIDDCYLKKQTMIDLKSSKFALPYVIDLSKMTQTRTHTGRVRKVQRVFTKTSYPSDQGGNMQTGTKRPNNASATLPVKKAKLANSTNNIQNSALSSSVSSLPHFSSNSNPHNFSFTVNPLFNTLHHPGGSSTGQGPITRRQYQNFQAQSSATSGSVGATNLQNLSNSFSPSLNPAQPPNFQFGGPGLQMGSGQGPNFGIHSGVYSSTMIRPPNTGMLSHTGFMFSPMASSSSGAHTLPG